MFASLIRLYLLRVYDEIEMTLGYTQKPKPQTPNIISYILQTPNNISYNPQITKWLNLSKRLFFDIIKFILKQDNENHKQKIKFHNFKFTRQQNHHLGHHFLQIHLR